MSALGLMTRGYICCKVPAVLIGPGPEITGAAILAPKITGSAQNVIQAPVIRSGSVQVPSLTGAVTPAPPAPGAPSLVGGNALVPIISSAEED